MKQVFKQLRFVFCISFAFALIAAKLSAQCPTLTIAGGNSICANGPVQLNASAGFTNYLWSPAIGLSNVNVQNPLTTLSGNYTVVASSIGPNLIVNPDFAVGNSGFTSGMTFTTNYSPCDYYVDAIWFGSYFPGLTDHTPTADNMFMDIDGCTSVTSIWEETVAVTPNTNYTFSFWASRADQVQPTFEMHFIGNATGDVIMNTVPGIPYTGVWTWDQYGVPIWNSGANTSVTLREINLQTNSYGNDFGMDDFLFQQYCVDSTNVQVTIAPAPNLGSDTSICGNATLQLNAGNANAYLWNTGATTQTINVSTSGMYVVTTTVGPCFFRDTVNVNVNPLPVVNLGADTILCPNSNIVLDASGPPENSYLWNTGNTSSTLNVNSTGNYFVDVTANGCKASDSVFVNVLPPLELGNAVSLCGIFSLTLDAKNPGSIYAWNNGATSQSIEVSAPGIYAVQVTNGNCVMNDTVEVSGLAGEGMLFLPNTFTPNGNGNNEKFLAYGEGIITFHMRIFNRWGEMIFETSDINTGWDGTYKGKIVQEDTYVYDIDYKTECNGVQTKNKIGHVNVIR